MASALGEELSQDDNRLVTKADLQAEVNGLKYWMLSRMVTLFSVALVIIGFMIRYLPPAG